MLFRPHQVLRIEDDWWEIWGNYLGALNQADLVGLKAITERDGDAHSKTVAEAFVPRKVLEAAIRGGAKLYDPAEGLA